MKTVDFQGLRIRIDRPKGYVQRGKDERGEAWERTYRYDYGYLPRTDGGDGEGLDVFVGPDPDADEAYWVSQVKADGKTFDEYKVFLGFGSRQEAKRAYLQHTPQKYYHSTVVMKVPLMRAMLGVDPGRTAKVAGLLDGLSRAVAGSW